jgi:glucokinase
MAQQNNSVTPLYALAGDIGGTQIRAALVNSAGEIIARDATDTRPEEGIDSAADRLCGLADRVSESVEPSSIVGFGISTAGPIDPTEGFYSHPPNLVGWHDKTMVPRVTELSGHTPNIIHDAHAAAFAEWKFGAAREHSDVVYVTVSTGLGGGMLSDGVPVNGSNGMAGEIGHLIIDPSGPACNAGCKGCLEVLAAGGGVARAAREAVANAPDSQVLALANGDPAAITGRVVYAASEAGDGIAIEIVERSVNALSIGFANLLATFDPGVIVVGGSVVVGDSEVAGLRKHWDDLIARVQQTALLRYRDHVPIVVSQLGDEVGLLGAAAYAFEQN